MQCNAGLFEVGVVHFEDSQCICKWNSKQIAIQTTKQKSAFKLSEQQLCHYGVPQVLVPVNGSLFSFSK